MLPEAAAFSRSRSQFFTIRTSQPANNIYILHGRPEIHNFLFSCWKIFHELGKGVLLYRILTIYNDDFFDDFPKISNHFRKISGDFPKLFWRPDAQFRTFSEDCRRRPKNIRRCFDHTSTNLSVVKGTKEKCYQKGMISSHVNDKNSIFTAHDEDMIF